MTPEQIKAEHYRLRPILFEGAPDWAKFVSMDYDDFEWHYFQDEPWTNGVFWDWSVE